MDEREIWQRVTGEKDGGNRPPEQAMAIGKEIDASRRRILTMNRIPETKGLVREEQETVKSLCGMYNLLMGGGPRLSPVEPLAGKTKQEILRKLLRSMEISSGRLWALSEHATGNIRAETEALARREQLLWRKLIQQLGQLCLRG